MSDKPIVIEMSWEDFDKLPNIITSVFGEKK